MSRVYKRNEIILGEEKIIKLKASPVIKSNKNLDIPKESQNEDQLDIQASINAERVIEEAKAEAARLIEQAQLEYEEILNRAESERQAIISEAYTSANEILEKAKKEGYNEGLALGQEAGLNEMDSLIEEAKDIKQGALIEKKAMAKSLEGELIHLVLSCVKKVIDHEIEKDHKLLLNLIEKGIEKCTYTDSLIIRVSSEDYEVVSSSKNKIYMMTQGIDSIEIKKDPALNRGSILIETISGTVDASLETQITQIEKLFQDILKGE